MIETIYKNIYKLSSDIWCYCLLGVLAVVFIVGLILSLVGGDFHRFLKAAKTFLKMPVAKSATEAAKVMPVKIRKLYKRAKTTGEKPSDVINFDACVSSTYASSFASRFTKTVLCATILLTVIGFSILSPIGSVVAAVGAVLTLIAGLISVLIYNGAVKTYNNYVDALDKLSKGGNYDESASEPANANVFASAQTVGEAVVEDEVPVYSASAEEPIVEEPVVTEASYDSTFEKSNKLDIEIEEEEPVMAQEPVSPVKNDDLNEIEEEIRREKEAAAAAAAAAAANDEQARRREAIERARAQAAERRASAEPEQTIVMTPPPTQAQAPTQEAPAQQSASASTGSSADDVIARIEQINRDGAPLATMKEVALLLQQERTKPENKTPEQQRKLNEALSSLLKSMSAATKK